MYALPFSPGLCLLPVGVTNILPHRWRRHVYTKHEALIWLRVIILYFYAYFTPAFDEDGLLTDESEWIAAMQFYQDKGIEGGNADELLVPLEACSHKEIALRAEYVEQDFFMVNGVPSPRTRALLWADATYIYKSVEQRHRKMDEYTPGTEDD